MILPAAFASPKVFSKLGASGGCVMGNLVTAFVTIGLLYVALSAPTTSAWFRAFVAILYLGFPFTVFSQLSTGPMLDVISPVNMRGYTQGLNTASLNFGQALTPWCIGLLADATTTATAIWTCIGVSFLAAAYGILFLLSVYL
jgi:predicted MFS family arabinose efflux permease